MLDMVIVKEYTITTLKQQGNITKTLHNEDTTMPNWCNNKATLKHKDSSMLVRAQEAFENGKLLQEFMPIPEELRNTTSGFYGDTEQQIELQAQQKANKEKYGYSDWYEFANAKWGVKWDIGGSDSESTIDGDTLTLDFDSAWCPPIAGYNGLADLGFEIEAYFYEGGMAFCGYYEGNEEYIDDVDEYGIEGDSEWVKKHIPQAIDEAFAISENMAYYEAEELGVEED